MNTSNYSQKISKGDVILIDGDLEFISDKDCEFLLYGDEIESFGQEKIAVKNYYVKCDAIDLDTISKKGYFTKLEKVNNENLFIVDSSTDVGGFYIFINKEKIAFCHNGFGDGNYRLKFTQGNLYR